jgi:peptide/nickel transport system substrate-binding protein
VSRAPRALRASARLRVAALALAALALVVAVSGCAQGQSPSAGPGEAMGTEASASVPGEAGGGGTLTIGMTAVNIPPLDTALSASQGYEGYRLVGYQLYDALTGWELQQSAEIPPLKPDLATSWTSNEDATEWTFKLRRGVTFTDGTPWNAAAAVFNFERFINPHFKWTSPELIGQAATFAGIVEAVEEVDPYTIKIKTLAPDSHLPEDLSVGFMASPTAVKKEGVKGFNSHPVGTGPFEFGSETQGQELELLPNPHYWAGAPKLEKLILKPLPDPAARIAALRSGAVNWIEYPMPDDIASLESEGFQVLANSYDHIWPWVLNSSEGPLKDVKVRQALNYAINREAMADSLLQGTAEPAYQIAPHANAAYTPKNDLYSYDPGKARQLLAEAGYPTGFTMTVEYPTGGSGNMIPQPMNEALQQELAAVGIDVKLKPVEWSSMLGEVVTGKFPSGVDAMNISLTFLQESSWELYFGTEGPINIGHYSNPKVDALFAEAQTTVDPEARSKLYQQASALITRDAPWLFVVNDRNPRALSPEVHDFVEPRSWFMDLTNVTVN